MGFTTGEINHEDMSMIQTPVNLYCVRMRAGLTIWECADALGVDAGLFHRAENFNTPLPDETWRKFLAYAGRRIFDAS